MFVLESEQLPSEPYVCVECGSVFRKVKHYTERHGLDSPPYEHYSGCPVCGGAYVPVKYCDCCNREITNDYIKTDDGHYYCDDCYSVRNVADDL